MISGGRISSQIILLNAANSGVGLFWCNYVFQCTSSWGGGDQLRLWDVFTSGKPHCSGVEVLTLCSSSQARCVLSSCGPRHEQEQASVIRSYMLAGQHARKPTGAVEAFGDPWGQAKLLEVALGCQGCCFRETGGQTILGTCPLCDYKACFCRKLCY